MTIGTWVRENKREVTVFLVFLVVYCGSITLNYSLSHDSTYYLNDIEYGPWIFHPHHLLFQSSPRSGCTWSVRYPLRADST